MSITTAWRRRIMFYRSAANIRLLPAILYVMLAACDVWVVEHGSISGLFSLAAQAVAVFWIARFRMRTPRAAVNWRERYEPLPNFLQHGGIEVVAKIVPGTRASARVRGHLTSPIVLISNRTALAWENNPRARDVQWAHETAHIGMGDAYVYYLTSSAMGLALFNQFLGNWRSQSNELILAMMALIALISVRAYCRARELAADSMASVILGDKPREELASSVILDANRLPFVGTHPSVRARLAVLENPNAMLNGATFFYFASAFMAVSVVVAFHHVLGEWYIGKFPVYVSLVIISLTIGWLASRHSAMTSVLFPTWRSIVLLLALSIGELSSFVVHDPSLVGAHHFLVIAGWSIAASTLAAVIGRAVGFTAALISATGHNDSESFSRIVLKVRVAAAILIAITWIVPWFI